MASTKVVILGGGFAGMKCAETLGKTSFDVLLIDRTNHHLFQPFLYEVATAALAATDIATPIRELLGRYRNVSVVMNEVISIDKEQRIVSLRDGEKVGYDYLVIALGSGSFYFGHDDWKKHTLSLKTLEDALKIREKILLAFEKAERCHSVSSAKDYLHFVVVGGGPEGVEMAGAIAEMSHHGMMRTFRHINPSMITIHLIESKPTILSSFPVPLAQKAQKYLEDLGVQVMTGTHVSDVQENGVKIGDTLLPSTNVFWCAGQKGSKVLESLHLPLDAQGRLVVDSDLTLSGHGEIFVIGDAAATSLPAIAPVAIQQGRYVAKRIMKKETAPFHYRDTGMMTAIGKTKAIGYYQKWQLSGFPAWLVWGLVHIFYLPGIKNRLSVLLQWFFSFFTGKRSARLIYRSS